MSFTSGRVTFCRFSVVGDAPPNVDDSLLGILREHAFRESEMPSAVEAGWITGEHLFDTEFNYEKNGFGNVALFAMRLDTHKVPPEVKHAYKRINETTAAADNPSGFASRGQKREAADLADRQVNEELAAKRFRKSKIVPVLWDLQNQTVLVGASGNTVSEEVRRLFHTSFAVELETLTAGRLASRLLRGKGLGRDYEDLSPSPFTNPPPEASAKQDDDFESSRDLNTPVIPWLKQAIDTKDFLGNEFVLWLWSAVENNHGLVTVRTNTGSSDVGVVLDKALDLDCAWAARGRMSLRGEAPTKMSESAEGLALGRWPRKVGLIVAASPEQWELTFQADQFVVAGAALPPVEEAASPREAIDQRVLSTRRLAQTLDGLYTTFLLERTSGSWPNKRGAIRQWITSRRRGKPAGSTAASTPAPELKVDQPAPQP